MNEMIKKTKKRLMWLFTVLTMLLLLLFITIAYLTVSKSVLNDQKDKVTQLISDESLGRMIHEASEPRERDFSNNLFAIATEGGEIVNKNNSNIDGLIKDWNPDSLEIKEKDHEDRDYLVAARPLEQAGYAYTAIDITQQKDVLHRLLIVLLLLACLFTFATMGLSFYMAGRSIGPIVQSVRRQREFVNDASHELRTPLSILSAGFEVLEEEEKRTMSAFSQETVEDMRGEVKRMSSLVNDLLFLARTDSEKVSIEKKTFNLSDVAKRSVRSFSTLLGETSLTLTSDIQENISFFGDKEKIRQLIFIFLDNAWKYNNINGSIHVQLTASSQTIHLVVEDSGIGIDAEDQMKIFERFYRVDQSRSRSLGGNGIGLSIADYIVKAHGGKIEVVSKAGQGARFTILIPT